MLYRSIWLEPVVVLKSLCLVCLALWASSALSGEESAEPANPEAVVLEATNRLLATLDEVRDIYPTDPDRYNAAIDSVLTPYVGMERIARRVMSKHYRKATKGQAQQFTQVFQASLVKTYGKLLLQLSPDNISIKPADYNAKGNRSIVRMEVFLLDGKQIPVTYRMYLDRSHGWKLENIIVNGINLGLTFKNQFNYLISEHRGGIDETIAAWGNKAEKDESGSE